MHMCHIEDDGKRERGQEEEKSERLFSLFSLSLLIYFVLSFLLSSRDFSLLFLPARFVERSRVMCMCARTILQRRTTHDLACVCFYANFFPLFMVDLELLIQTNSWPFR